MAGYRVVGRNVRVAGREVDIVARRGSLLVVCEVKARRSDAYGRPLDAIDRRKQERLRRAAEILVARDPGVRAIRFDVVVVEGWRSRHLQAVF
jgi:putative endonuclease